MFSSDISTDNSAIRKECIFISGLTQNKKEFEEIVVDGILTDKSPVLINNFLSDTCIRYIYKDNQAVCSARDNTIPYAILGQLTFMDNDTERLHDYIAIIKEAKNLFPSGKNSCNDSSWVNSVVLHKHYEFSVFDFSIPKSGVSGQRKITPKGSQMIFINRIAAPFKLTFLVWMQYGAQSDLYATFFKNVWRGKIVSSLTKKENKTKNYILNSLESRVQNFWFDFLLYLGRIEDKVIYKKYLLIYQK